MGTLTDFLREHRYNTTNQESIAEEDREQYFNNLEEISWIESPKIKKIVDDFDKTLSLKQIDRNKINWSILFPISNFGWTGSHLNQNEIDHFTSIQTLFLSEINRLPQDWNLIASRKLISSSTKEGYIIVVGTESRPDLFVIKSPKFDDNSLMHEFLVGSIVSNALRREFLPNFPYYFGLLRCSEAQVDSGKLESWCENEPESPQIIMEHIRDSSSFYNIVKKSSQHTIQLFLQVFNALYIAFDLFRFSHNDLHLANILIRSTHPKGALWPIRFGRNLGYLRTSMIAIIIDFDRASFSTSGNESFFAKPSSTKISRPETFGYSHPLTDILFLISIIYVETKDSIVKKILSHIYEIFYQMVSVRANVNELNFVATNLENHVQTTKTQRYAIYFGLWKYIENLDFFSQFFERCMGTILIPYLIQNQTKSEFNYVSKEDLLIKSDKIEKMLKESVLDQKNENGNQNDSKKRKLDQE